MFSSDDNLGLFEGHEQVRRMREIDYEQTKEGLVCRRACEKCDLDVEAEITWVELYCVSKGVLPQKVSQNLSQWTYNQKYGKMYPVLKCRNCNQIVAFPFTPSDADRRVRQAHDGNTMSQQQLGACQQIAQAFAARAGQAQQKRR